MAGDREGGGGRGGRAAAQADEEGASAAEAQAAAAAAAREVLERGESRASMPEHNGRHGEGGAKRRGREEGGAPQPSRPDAAAAAEVSVEHLSTGSQACAGCGIAAEPGLSAACVELLQLAGCLQVEPPPDLRAARREEEEEEEETLEEAYWREERSRLTAQLATFEG